MTALPAWPLTEDGVDNALLALGRNPEDIAAALAKHEIKGERFSESRDPVSNYLRKVLPPFDDIYVWAHDVRIEATNEDVPGWPTPFVIRVFCRPSLAAFIDQCDADMYPELIEEDSHA